MKNILLGLAISVIATSVSASTFSFVVVGDTAYRGESSVRAYISLIELINETQPDFTIHVGDIWGASICSSARYEEAVVTFELYDQPLIYTPGDNEWTDCNRVAYGGYENSNSLWTLREVFFTQAQSFGKQKIPLVRQGDVSDEHAKYVENVRWLQERVLFLTLNVPGSNNNLLIDKEESLLEAHERNEANIAWLRDSFRIVEEQDLVAVVIALHAEMFEGTGGVRVAAAYADLVNELRIVTERSGKPILLVHGDQHRLTLDRPLSRFGADGLDYGNFTRLQVYGDPEIRAMRVTVNTEKPWVFGYEPLYLE